MANVSSASVKIVADKSIADAVFEYIKVVQGDAEYNIIDKEALIEQRTQEVEYVNADTNEGKPVVVAEGYASGRWAYASNLDSYFQGPMTSGGWRDNKEAHLAYGKMVASIKRHKGSFRIEYKDVETGAGFIDVGEMSIGPDNVYDDNPTVISESFDPTVDNMMDVLDMSESEAIDMLYGEEIGMTFDEYKNKGGDRDAEDFYNSYADDIYSGKTVDDLLANDAEN